MLPKKRPFEPFFMGFTPQLHALKRGVDILLVFCQFRENFLLNFLDFEVILTYFANMPPLRPHELPNYAHMDLFRASFLWQL